MSELELERLRAQEQACPYCDIGWMGLNMKRAGAYPMIECNNCNAFGLLPVEGHQSPFKAIANALHRQGIEVGRRSSIESTDEPEDK